MTYLAEHRAFFNLADSAFLFPDDDAVVNTNTLQATLIFLDDSRLYVRASLDDTTDVREYDYAYVYYDKRGRRIFQYDDAPHHPHISTHPYHLHRGVKPKRRKERIYPLDLPRVAFIAIVEQVLARLR